MHFNNRLKRGGSVLLLTGLLLLSLPVQRVYAQEVAPLTQSAVLDDIPVRPLEADPQADGTAAALGDQGAPTEGPNAERQTPFESLPTEEESVSELAAADHREVSNPILTPIPFTGLGVSGSGPDAPDVRWRALRDDDGEWSEWAVVEAIDGFDGPDPGTDESRGTAALHGRWVSEAIWVGPATQLQLAVDGASLEDLHVAVIDSAGLSESVLARASRTLRSLTTKPPAAEASALQPPIVPRSQWVDTEACTSGTMSYSTPKAAVLHHTATTNSYTPEQAPQQIRNMYHWHTSCHGINGNGWYDIGYNFIVDRFGTIYEGRRGGIARGVVGAHAGGWNTGTVGVALMGNYNTAVPSVVELEAIGRLLGWKFDLHGIAPGGTTTLNSQVVPTLFAHRNVRGAYVANPSTTIDCPGQNLYTRMSSIQIAGWSIDTVGWTPVVGDWNGNGVTTVGWFRDGVWRLRNSNGAGLPDVVLTYGRVGDLPVVGDWNGNGRTTLGVVRGSSWLLRNDIAGGPAHITFNYGVGASDFPMAGDWNANGRSTPAIVRDGDWHLRNSLTSGPGEIVFRYGRITDGDLPVVGDWNGDGRDTPGILRSGEWHLRNRLSGGAGEIVFVYGRLAHGDLPVIGDWNGDRRAGPGITRSAEWHLRNSLSAGPAHQTFLYG